MNIYKPPASLAAADSLEKQSSINDQDCCLAKCTERSGSDSFFSCDSLLDPLDEISTTVTIKNRMEADANNSSTTFDKLFSNRPTSSSPANENQYPDSKGGVEHKTRFSTPLKMNFAAAVEAGIQFVGVVSASSYQIASGINRATTDLADHQIRITADAISSHADSWAQELSIEERWRNFLKSQISKGSTVLTDAVNSVSSGFDSALTMINRFATSGVARSLETVRKIDAGLETALQAGTHNPRMHGVVGAAHAMLEILAPLTVVSPWEVGRAFGALSMLQKQTAAAYPPKSLIYLDLSLPTNHRLLNDLAYRYRQALAAYTPRMLKLCRLRVKSASCRDLIQELLGLDADSLILVQESSSVHQPAYFLAVDHFSKSICLVIRGSTEAADVFTDLCCRVDPITGTHIGIQRSADWVAQCTGDVIRTLCIEYPNYSVAVLGHSLGGGTATLVTFAWINDPVIGGLTGDRIHGYSFGCPCVVTPEMSCTLKKNVTSIVYARDIVSRASWGSTKNLNRVILHLIENRTNSVLSVTKTKLYGSIENSKIDSATSSINNNISTVKMERSVSYPGVAIEENLIESQQNIKMNSFPLFLTSMPRYHSKKTPEAGNAECSEERQGLIFSPHDTLDKSLAKLNTDTLLYLLNACNSLPENGSFEQKKCLNDQLRIAANAIWTLHSKESVLCPAGRVLTLLPTAHIKTGIPIQNSLTPGGSIIAELTDEAIFEMSSQIILQRGAFSDHVPECLAIALGVQLDFSNADMLHQYVESQKSVE